MAVERVHLKRLKAKRITIGIGVASGIHFRIEDNWSDNRPFKDGTHSPYAAKVRKAAHIKTHKVLASVGPWTGSTVFITKLADSSVDFNPDRHPNKETGKIRRLDHPKVPQDNVTCTFYGQSESDKSRLRASACGQAYKEFSRRWYTEENAKFTRHKTSTLLEVCCSPDSRLCADRYVSSSSRTVRLTKDDDVSSAEGLRKGIDAIRAPNAGHVTLWISMDRTWGSTSRRYNSDDERLENFTDQSIKLWDKCQAVFPNIVVLAYEVRSNGGDIVMEWSTGNALWNPDFIKLFVDRFKLIPVEINGCTLGHHGNKGGLLYKPWTLMTSSPYIYDVFQDCKCPGAEHKGKHETIDGDNTWKSALYPLRCAIGCIMLLANVLIRNIGRVGFQRM